MPWIRVLLLVATLTVTSGYAFRCYWFCTDQTAVQDNYVEQRDRCREDAQLKLDMTLRNYPGPVDETVRKSQLVSLFSQCMGNNGWTVPDGGKDGKLVGMPPAAAPGSPAANTYRATVSRNAECAFARQSASVSSIAAMRAKACDIECAQRLQSAPEAPRPAACPDVTKPMLKNGYEE